jgi:hypothetical protein
VHWREILRAAGALVPAWWVWNPGGGGGSGTVHTDGVTITGDGSTGNPIAILQVETDATLAGAGTVASPLGVADWPLPYISAGDNNNAFVVTANQVSVYGFVIPYRFTFSNIAVASQTGDSVNNSDVGIYSAAGNLVAHIGAQAIQTFTGLQAFAVVGGAKTLPPGVYFFGWTSAANVLTLAGNSGTPILSYTATAAASAGGALPGTITPPANSATIGLVRFLLY